MCGPSQAMKNINNEIQTFSGTMVSEAKTIFGDASSMFNTISNAVGKVIAGGPNQQGWGAGLASSVTAGIVNAAATAGRNVKSALGAAIGAIGGGNTVAPSGAMANVTANALENVEAQKTQQEEQATVANYQQGNANYNAAIAAGEKAPSMFDVVDKNNANAMSGLTTAASSQAAMDKANSWWKPLVMGEVGSAASMAESGFQNLDTTGGSTVGEQGKNFLQGMFGMSTGGGGGSSSSGGGGSSSGGGGLSGLVEDAAMFA